VDGVFFAVSRQQQGPAGLGRSAEGADAPHRSRAELGPGERLVDGQLLYSSAWLSPSDGDQGRSLRVVRRGSGR
jgi:hypothetical protein